VPQACRLPSAYGIGRISSACEPVVNPSFSKKTDEIKFFSALLQGIFWILKKNSLLFYGNMDGDTILSLCNEE
jgi:hypothetical protein